MCNLSVGLIFCHNRSLNARGLNSSGFPPSAPSTQRWNWQNPQLEGREDQAYDNLERGNIYAEAYRRQVKRFRQERLDLNAAIQAVQTDINGGFRETALTTLELCKEAKSLYKTRSLLGRADFIKRLVSNPRLNGVNVE